MIKKLELDEEAHRRLALHCAAQGIEFFSTPFSEEAVAMLVRQGVRRLKLPSARSPTGACWSAPPTPACLF